MYPSSPISSSNNNFFHIAFSPSSIYENEFFQDFHDQHLLQPPQLQFLTATPGTPNHHHHQQQHQYNNLDDTNMANEEDSNNKREEGCIKINKKSRSKGTTTSKKDRHSKINTAQGPRDRRMRLSLDVARKFFNLQDLLGFDKASKTVEWLLNKSDSAVKELEQEGTISNTTACIIGGGAISASASTSECEVISSEIIDESAITDQQQQTVSGNNNKGEINNNKKKAKTPRVRAAIVHPVVGKESRKQARERARERTTLKKSLNNKNNNNNIGHDSAIYSAADDLKRLGSWTPLEFQSGNITKEDVVVVDDSNLVVNTGNWPSPLPNIFNNYHHNTETSHEHQWKLWEA